VNLERSRSTVQAKVGSQQTLDDRARPLRFGRCIARTPCRGVRAGETGPRQEEVDSLRGQVQQAKGALSYAETNLATRIFARPSRERFWNERWRKASS